MDQVSPETLDAMRAEMSSWMATPEAQNLVAGMTDEEILNAVDRSHPGGADALAAELGG